MKTKLIAIVLFCVMIAGVFTCEQASKTENGKKIQLAMDAIDNEDLELAYKLSTEVMDTPVEVLTAENYCDLTIIYMLIYDDSSARGPGYKMKKSFNNALAMDKPGARKYLKSYDEDILETIQLNISLYEMSDLSEWDFLDY